MSSDSEGALNRFAVALLALLCIFAALAAVILAWAAPEGSIDGLRDFTGFLEDHNNRDGKLIVSLGALVVVLAMLCVLILELIPSSTQKMRVQNVKSGDVTITTARIAEVIDGAVRTVSHVAECSSTVARHGRRVEVVLDLHVDTGAELAQTADEACRRAHTLVEQLGIELSVKPRARLYYRELRLRTDAQPDAGTTA